MVNLTKIEAQKRTDLIYDFKAELEHLEAEDVVSLTDEQRNRIETYHQDELESMSSIYDIDRTRQEKHYLPVQTCGKVKNSLSVVGCVVCQNDETKRYVGI